MAETRQPVTELLTALRSATDAKKCHRCGCFRGAVEQLHRALPALPQGTSSQLLPILEQGMSRLVPSEYDCLGCAICWPADALNIATEEFPEAGIAADESCPTAPPERVQGWPPYPGNFRVLDASGDVAVCVLTSEHLIASIADASPRRVAMVGAVYTENLGLERIVSNILPNPNITTLLICGADSLQRIGHLPGQSFLSLMANGIDERGRIIGAEGRRPVVKNLPPNVVEEFRSGVSIVDQVGQEDAGAILALIAGLPVLSARHGGGNVPLGPDSIIAGPPAQLVLDPKGYFVIFPDRINGRIVIEHYENGGTLAHVLTGRKADEICATILAQELVSRLDHAAYLGKELALAERALRTGEAYVQDRALEPACDSSCGCHSSIGRAS